MSFTSNNFRNFIRPSKGFHQCTGDLSKLDLKLSIQCNVLRSWTSIEYHFAFGSCFKIIHLPNLIRSIIHIYNFNSRILIWTFVHCACELLVLILDQSFRTILKLIHAFLLVIGWITILVKARMIAAYTLWKVPCNTIDSRSSSISSSIIALLATVSVVHGVILRPVIIIIPGCRSCVVVLVWRVSNLGIGDTHHIAQHDGQCEQNEPILRNHFCILKIINC